MADSSSDPREGAMAAIKALSADYLAGLPARLDAIEEAWRAVAAGAGGADALQNLHRSVHGITGSGRMFGLPQVSDAARVVETDLKALLDTPESARAELCARIESGLVQLRETERCVPR